MSCVKLVLEIRRRSRGEPRARLMQLKNWNWSFVGRAGAVVDNAFHYAWGVDELTLEILRNILEMMIHVRLVLELDLDSVEVP